VVYTFLPHAHILGRYAARRAGVRHIISSQQVANWGGWTMRALERWTARWCEKVIAVSDGVRDDLVRRTGVPADRVRVIFNAIDVATYRPRTVPFDRGDDRFVIGSASRLAPEKDHRSLLRGMATAVREIPQLRLRLAGHGPLESQLRAEVTELGLGDRVELLGHVDDVRAFYESLDVYVQPSHTEGLPCAVLEAMAMARPVIATDVPGNRDAVAPGETGWLIPARAPAAWVEALHLVRGDVAEARRRGQAGRRRAMDRFDATPMVDATFRLLQELLQAE
jgi:glycosyltransferase involved in cell wall biosynthesis